MDLITMQCLLGARKEEAGKAYEGNRGGLVFGTNCGRSTYHETSGIQARCIRLGG